VAFVLPTGYSFNCAEQTIYLSMASIFRRPASRFHLTLGQQLVIDAGVDAEQQGSGGSPRSAFVILMATAATFGLPVETASNHSGIDALLDMPRTA